MAKWSFLYHALIYIWTSVHARVNSCVREEDKEPRASYFFVTWWAVAFQSFKKPLYQVRQTDRHRKRATDREGEIESGQIHGTMTHRSARLLQ